MIIRFYFPETDSPGVRSNQLIVTRQAKRGNDNRSPTEANIAILITDVPFAHQLTYTTSRGPVRVHCTPRVSSHVVKQRLSSSPGAPVTRDPVVRSGKESGEDSGRGEGGHYRDVPPPRCSITSLPLPLVHTLHR